MDDDRIFPDPEERDEPDPAEGVRIIGAEEAAAAIERGDVARRRGSDEPKYGDAPPKPDPEGPRPALRFPLGETADPTELERPPLAGSPAGVSLPHWTEPATGEVPRILPEDPSAEEPGEDLEAWSSFANQAPRWREESSDWAGDPGLDLSDLGGDDVRVGALDDGRPGVADLFSFDDEPEPEPEPPPPAAEPQHATRQIRIGGQTAMSAMGTRGGGERNMVAAVGVGVGLVAVAFFLSTLGPGVLMALVTAVIVVAAAELFDAFRKVGYQPATLLALVAVGALVLAAYWRGEAAFPLVLFLMVVFGLLWYLSGGVPEHTTTNLGVTLLGVAWVGGLGAFAALLLKLPDGVGLFWGAVLPTVAYDVGGLFVGGSFGRAPLAPNVSPNKTIEGLAGGFLAAVIVATALGVFGLSPWDSVFDAFRLGVIVGIAAPLGDLCESLVKRDLGLKDMGTLLPGHGGLIDRFDALLFVLPAVYYLARLLEPWA